MQKTILGLDLGTTSIGWALVNEGENSSIIKTGVRVIPLSTDEIRNFDTGKTITTNADRTIKRAARRNLQRYKLRREVLIKYLLGEGLITQETMLAETGNHSTFETYRNRAKAATSQIELSDFARVLLMINKKRGYKSSRKVQGEDEGQAIDGMAVALQLYEDNMTPGQLVHSRFEQGIVNVPDFYRSDLQNEFRRIWDFQSQFYSEHLTNDHLELLLGKSTKETKDFFKKRGDEWEVPGKNGLEKKKSKYLTRARATHEQVSLGELSEILADINAGYRNSSGYLGAISDRSKELYFKKQTVGQFLYGQIGENPHIRLKNQVFYRQDYLDEFNTIWEKQQEYYPEVLTEMLKKDIRDVVIFYQRPLKSQKGLLSICEFERKPKELIVDGQPKTKLIGPKVCPKSSPLFQEFKIWAQLNNVVVSFERERKGVPLELEQKQLVFETLSWKEKISATEAIKLLGIPKGYKLNFEYLEGNRTNAALIQSLEMLFDKEGYENLGLTKLNRQQLFATIVPLMDILGIKAEILTFDSSIEGKDFEQQPAYQLWHLLYSFAGDNSKSGIETLRVALAEKFGFPKETNTVIANTVLPADYSSLSLKAIKKILPFLRDGSEYSLACEYAGYNHSNSETKEQRAEKILQDKLAILPKNSLRNPVVEKILNQMVHVVNGIIDTYGKPDEIRIEMARELKKSAKERNDTSLALRKSSDEHERYKRILQAEFGLSHVSRNDLIRYKLYLELEQNGFKTLYSNVYIEKEKLFTKEFDIEHIIPKAKLYDDSFSNKTLELRSVNLKKSNFTSHDFVLAEYGEQVLEQYKGRVAMLFGNQFGKKTKFRKLLITDADIPTGFIDRDLRDSQYIAKKAKEMLSEVIRSVHTTTGSVTQRLREDWQLVDVMKELNWEKYHAVGMTEEVENRHGQKISQITEWTKRNDHRHHAMDAITVAFTKPSHVQYLNNLNARSDKNSIIYNIQQKETYFDNDQKRRFNPPMRLEDFRRTAKEHLEQILVSFKAKNKVFTKNKNITQTKLGKKTVISETPRGQLHLETVYGSSKGYVSKMEKIGAAFTVDKIAKVANEKQRIALLQRLELYGNDPKKAFTGINSLSKNPIYLDKLQTRALPDSVKLVELETRYTIRKDISKDLKIDKVIDAGVRKILQARLEAFGGDAAKAFSNLEANPIYLNRAKGIELKKVTISGVSNAIPLHEKRDHLGKLIVDQHGVPIPVDFVNTGNNHHVAIYRDEKGNLQDEVKSFYEVVERKNQGLPAIDYDFKNGEGWNFLFSLKQNEYFIFPDGKTGFDPKEIDLLDPRHLKQISPHLFRVQKFSKTSSGNSFLRDYVFRHHLETTLSDRKELKDVVYKRIQSTSNLKGIIKVRLNHLGLIIQVGE